MQAGPVHDERALPTPHQAAEMPPPGEGAFDSPAAAVTPPLPPIWPRRVAPMAPMGTEQLAAPPGQALAPRGRVTGLVIAHPLGILARPSWAPAGHGHGVQGGFQPRHLSGGRRVHAVAQRTPWAVDHHPPLRA